jgi:fido (protein-threonine AMPylation protein)
MGTDFHSRTWEPITDLPDHWETSLRNSQTEALVQAWLEQAAELRQKGIYQDFLSKLKRQWSIETGIIEGLYSLSEGATKALIEKGFDASLISHTDTDDDPQNIITRITDHQMAIDGLYAFISGNRPLGTSYIKELHSVITAHQKTYEARDLLGNTVTRELPRGQWKVIKNNVEHEDNSVFEFCPPEHVAQEMDNLIGWHLEHSAKSVPADVEAAWLHHRFSIIHPFTDGNGRVARCLATLVLLKHNWLPLVVDRKDRSRYIEALRRADANDLRPLIDFIGSLQRKAIREAFSLSEHVIMESTAVAGILAAVKDKFSKRRQAEEDRRRRAIATADSLFVSARDTFAARASEISRIISDEGVGFRAYESEGAKGSNQASYYYNQIIACAKRFDYFVNFNVYQAWTALVIKAGQRCEILVSFHGIGRDSSGVLGCAAMFFTKVRNEDNESQIGDLVGLGEEPFEFTYTEDQTEVQRRFHLWLDQIILRGLTEWQRIV